MEIILLEALNKIGKAGEIVSVKDGFANNYLIPQKKAIIANKKNRDELSSKISQINEKNEMKIKEASGIKTKLDNKAIEIEMEANEDGNLYGNITHKQIIDKLVSEFSINLQTENIIIGNIKTLGKHEINLRLYNDITACIDLDVIKKL